MFNERNFKGFYFHDIFITAVLFQVPGHTKTWLIQRFSTISLCKFNLKTRTFRFVHNNLIFSIAYEKSTVSTQQLSIVKEVHAIREHNSI